MREMEEATMKIFYKSQRSPIICTRLIFLLIFGATCLVFPRVNAIWEWHFEPTTGFPNIDIVNEQVHFKYNYTGILSEGKTFTEKLYQVDCLTAANASALLKTTSYNVDLQKLKLDVDFNFDEIITSDHYTYIDSNTASIKFCLRIDYWSGDVSMNYHETVLDVR